MVGPKCWSPTALGPAVSRPRAGGCALLGLVPKAAMVPAKSLGWGGGGCSGGTTGWGAGAGAASAVGGELQRRDEPSQLADLCSQVCNLGGDRAGGGGATGVAGEVTDVTVGNATSMILSAMSARVSNETLSPDEARTIRTWLGSR